MYISLNTTQTFTITIIISLGYLKATQWQSHIDIIAYVEIINHPICPGEVDSSIAHSQAFPGQYQHLTGRWPGA